MVRKLFTSLAFVIFISSICNCKQKNEVSSPKDGEAGKHIRPNIVLFYVDDLGYADLGCYGAKGVSTPNIDRLAAKGIKFTDAHSSSSTCTPSRYSLLTGNHAFRNNAAILPGDAPLLIDTRMTALPKMLVNAGYATAIVGKWHLGLGYGKVDWNKRIAPGANEVGFGYSFLLPATGDRVPTVFVENGMVVNLSKEDPLSISYSDRIGQRPVGYENPGQLKMGADRQHSETIVNGISRIGYMAGGKKAEWVDEDFPYVFNAKAKGFIQEHRENPFFLFYSFHDIHVPRSPHDNFKGKSSMGPRGDAILQVDYVIGEIVGELENLGLAENTLIIFTSDNGPVLDDGYEDRAVELLGDHNPSGPFRGGKYSSYEAGTRVPTIVYWPGTVEPKVSDAMMNQVDLYASLSSMVGQPMPKNVLDSENHLDTWLGKSGKGRETMLEEGFTLALRDGNWKYILPLEPSKTIPDWMANKTEIESGLMKTPQLFDLSNDIGEREDLSSKYPDKVKAYKSVIHKIMEQGPGPKE